MSIGRITDKPLETLQKNTLDEAQKALEAKLITAEQFERMTDGRVSTVDMDDAKRIVEEASYNEVGPNDQFWAEMSARNLQHAVLEQLGGQGFFASMWESLRDLKAQKKGGGGA